MTGSKVRDRIVGSTHHIFSDKKAAGDDTSCFRCDATATWKQGGTERSPNREVDFTLDLGFDNSSGGLTFSSKEPSEWESGEWVELGDCLEVLVETNYNGRNRAVEVHWRKKGESEEHRLLYTCVPNAKTEPAEEHVEVTLDGRFLIHWMMPGETQD